MVASLPVGLTVVLLVAAFLEVSFACRVPSCLLLQGSVGSALRRLYTLREESTLASIILLLGGIVHHVIKGIFVGIGSA